MTRAALTATLAALCLGCAAHTKEVIGNSGRLGSSSLDAAPGGAHPLNAQAADSFTLAFHAPSFGHYSCDEPDTSRPLRDAQWVSVLRLKGQAAAYRPGCEASVACWDSVRWQTAPDTVWASWAVPGARCSVRVGPGLYHAHVRNQRCAWGRVVRVP